jgi:hypothetical protein
MRASALRSWRTCALRRSPTEACCPSDAGSTPWGAWPRCTLLLAAALSRVACNVAPPSPLSLGEHAALRTCRPAVPATAQRRPCHRHLRLAACPACLPAADKLKDKLDEDDKEKIEKAVQDGLDWLDDNQVAG